MLNNTLFVAQQASNTVGTYNATTGAAINPSFITGLSGPQALAVLSSTLVPDSLFVVNIGVPVGPGTGTIGKYDATTGAVINAGFITGLTSPAGIAVK